MIKVKKNVLLFLTYGHISCLVYRHYFFITPSYFGFTKIANFFIFIFVRHPSYLYDIDPVQHNKNQTYGNKPDNNNTTFLPGRPFHLNFGLLYFFLRHINKMIRITYLLFDLIDFISLLSYQYTDYLQ